MRVDEISPADVVPSAPAYRRYAYPILFFLAGGLAAAQIGLTAYQAQQTKESGDEAFRNRLNFMLFVASWTFLFSVVHLFVNLYVGAALSFLTFLFWPLATALWSEVQDTSLVDCKGTRITSTCSQWLAIEAVGWAEVGAVALLFFTVALHFRSQYEQGHPMTKIGRSGFYRR